MSVHSESLSTETVNRLKIDHTGLNSFTFLLLQQVGLIVREATRQKFDSHLKENVFFAVTELRCRAVCRHGAYFESGFACENDE